MCAQVEVEVFVGGGGRDVVACEGGGGSSGAHEEPRIASHPRLSSRNAIYLLERCNYPLFSEPRVKARSKKPHFVSLH